MQKVALLALLALLGVNCAADLIKSYQAGAKLIPTPLAHLSLHVAFFRYVGFYERYL